MNIKLIKLVLQNFKGIKHYELNAEGNNISIFGDNETGKTTVADAFYWLLFNKDSSGATKFSVKTLDEAGKEIHNLEHSVYMVLNVDGVEHHLKKVYKENWPTKKGSATSVFDGHKTIYEIGATEKDLTPKKMSEFNSYIKTIFNDEQVFKLVTNPLTFNALGHTEKKKILMDITGEVSDEDVINSDKELQELKEVLSNSTLEDFKLRISRDKKAISEDLKAIPHRIDEIMHNLPDIAKYSIEKLKEDRTLKAEQIEALRAQISEVKAGSDVIELEMKKKRLIADRELLEGSYNSDTQRVIDELKKDISSKEKELKRAEYHKADLTDDINSFSRKKEEINSQYKQAASRFNAKTQEVKEFSTAEICECCGQSIPEEKQQAAIKKMEESYNLSKSKELEELTADIEKIKGRAAELKEVEAATIDSLKVSEEEIKEINIAIESLREQQQQAKSNLDDVTASNEYKELTSRIDAIENDIANSRQKAQEKIAIIEVDEIIPLQTELNELNLIINDIELAEKSTKRIKELEEKQQSLAAEYERLEHSVYLTEAFTRAKVRLMEDTINSKFRITKFKMFEEHGSGGISEICEATHKGVPFGKGLNTAHRINVGLDIINTLSSHYRFYAPIMIDNAEAVTKLEATESQQVRFYVSETDKKLRMEIK